MAIRVWGASYSVYSRMLRLALLEKGVTHEWIETDVFGDAGARAGQMARHPWGQVPAMEDVGVTLYETRACLEWLDGPGFGALRLMPEDPLRRARAAQVASVVDARAYRSMVWDVFVELVEAPAEGREPDRARAARGLAASETVLDALEAVAVEGAVLGAGAPTAAEVTLAPVLACFAGAAEGREALARRPALSAWWAEWRARPSMRETRQWFEEAVT